MPIMTAVILFMMLVSAHGAPHSTKESSNILSTHPNKDKAQGNIMALSRSMKKLRLLLKKITTLMKDTKFQMDNYKNKTNKEKVEKWNKTLVKSNYAFLPVPKKTSPVKLKQWHKGAQIYHESAKRLLQHEERYSKLYNIYSPDYYLLKNLTYVMGLVRDDLKQANNTVNISGKKLKRFKTLNETGKKALHREVYFMDVYALQLRWYNFLRAIRKVLRNRLTCEKERKRFGARTHKIDQKVEAIASCKQFSSTKNIGH